MKKVVLALSLLMSFSAFGMEGDDRFLMQGSESTDSENWSDLDETEVGAELIPYGNGSHMTREQFERMADRCDDISTMCMLAFYIILGVISVSL